MTVKPGEQIARRGDIVSGHTGRVIETREAFIEHWRFVAAHAPSGHDVIANANTVSRMVRVFDALAEENAELRRALVSQDPSHDA